VKLSEAVIKVAKTWPSHFVATSLLFVTLGKSFVVASCKSDFCLLFKLIKIFFDLLSMGTIQTCASTQW